MPSGSAPGYSRLVSSLPPPKPGRLADAEAAVRARAGEPAARAWWRRVPRTLWRPRDVFVALEESDEDDLAARQEPILAIALLAGMGGVFLTPAWGRLLDSTAVDGLVVAVVTFIGGGFYGAAGYFLLGLAVWLGTRGVGVQAPFRLARHVVAFSCVPLALSLFVTAPLALAAFGGDFFSSGGSDDGAGRATVVGVGLVFGGWAVSLLVVGLRTTYRLPWRGVAGALALAGVLVAAFAVLPSAL